MKDFDLIEFDYKNFYDNIQNMSGQTMMKILKKETDNFDIYQLCSFYGRFFDLATNQRLHNIKSNDVDIIFLRNNEDLIDICDFKTNIAYSTYRIEKGELIKTGILIKFDLIEPINIHYYTCIYDFLFWLEELVLNYASKKQLKGLEPKAKKLLISQEPEAFDLSSTSCVSKLIYLNELGIIEQLRKQPCFGNTTNNLASVISAITGENSKTIQSALNALLNPNTSQKNNPYNTSSTVEKVKNQLIQFGAKPK
ncbi:hypothetical protein ACI6PS_11580 [Flavobacterium sp. PLA-1-15]|uniref:hypothetical protein n=1 Tax=Flavobacterium sp. PLA-1-15 TaxID=3380533 RepID=UPI003B7B9A52